MRNQTKQYPVSIIVPMKNSETTIIEALRTILQQSYPLSEIIVIDNISDDNSVSLVRAFRKKSKVPIKLIIQKKDNGVGASYNTGSREAKNSLIVFMHSDSSLPTKLELKKLVSPILKDKNIVATYSVGILPKKVWNSYNFWQKCLFARDVGSESPGFSGKFSCLRKEAFLRIGGFDELNFGIDKTSGGEDADLYLRLEKKGEIILTKAKVIHLHYLGKNFNIVNWIKTRKLLARTYGRFIRFEGNKLPLGSSTIGLSLRLGVLIFLVKPILAILPLIPNFHTQGALLLFVYALLNSKSLYTNMSSIKNIRILLLPFIDVFLVYYETFWMLESFLSVKKQV